LFTRTTHQEPSWVPQRACGASQCHPAAVRGPARRDRRRRSQPEAQSAGRRRIASLRRAGGWPACSTPRVRWPARVRFRR